MPLQLFTFPSSHFLQLINQRLICSSVFSSISVGLITDYCTICNQSLGSDLVPNLGTLKLLAQREADFPRCSEIDLVGRVIAKDIGNTSIAHIRLVGEVGYPD